MVAGATGAIGRATCAELLRRGASVIGLARDRARLGELQHDLAHFDHRFIPMSLAGHSEACWSDAIERAGRLHGAIDLFVHAIGVLIPGAVLELDEREIEAIISANLLSVVSAARTIGPHMIAQGRGHFIVVVSLGGLLPMPFQSIYAAAKFAIRGFCLSVHEEFRPQGVFVSMVAPGPVRSPMLDAEAIDARAALAFAARPAAPSKVAGDIIRVIRRPCRELVAPGVPRLAVAVLNAFPSLFGLLLPCLQRLGRRRLCSYVPCGRNG